jgi:hypothetical protein
VAHIEYSAIDLALDAVYRYPFMPLDYKCDWLEVAADEVRHFKMLEGLLVDLGYNYGDFLVHSGLLGAKVEDVAVRFGIVLLVIQGMDDVLTGAFYGGQKFSRNAKIELSLKLLLAAVVCVVAYLYRSLTIIFSIMVVFSIIKLLIKISSLDSFVKKDFLLSITNEDINSIRLLLDFSKWQFLLNLGSIVFSSADKILIASIFGSAELARYNICSLLSQYIFSLSRSFLSIIFPIVSSKVSRGYALKSFLTMHKLLVLSFICIIPFIIVTPLASFILSLLEFDDGINTPCILSPNTSLQSTETIALSKPPLIPTTTLDIPVFETSSFKKVNNCCFILLKFTFLSLN